MNKCVRIMIIVTFKCLKKVMQYSNTLEVVGKYIKARFIIYAYTESFLEKGKNNSENIPATKVISHTACDCLVFAEYAFGNRKKNMTTTKVKTI